MSAEPNIRERLFDLCVGHGEWHIRKGDGICMTFSHSDSLNPEREAIAWLAEHQERYPERFAGYEVHRVTVQSELQLAALAVLDELDRLRATPAPGAPGQEAAFPARILALLHEVADRVGTEFRGPFEDGNGDPLQDDADAAIEWIARQEAAAVQAVVSALRQIIEADDAGCLTQQLIDIGRAALPPSGAGEKTS